jgi:hyperosmotically inducible periplasmic protein
MSVQFKILPAITLGALGFCASTMAATSGPLVGAGGFPVLKEIVVTGTKQRSADDEKLNDEVKTAMKSDRYFYDYHVAVDTKNGVVTLRGLVFDDWDVRAAIRISKRIPGVKRVVNQLEIGAQP